VTAGATGISPEPQYQFGSTSHSASRTDATQSLRVKTHRQLIPT